MTRQTLWFAMLLAAMMPVVAYVAVAHPDLSVAVAVAGVVLLLLPLLAPLRFKVERPPVATLAPELFLFPVAVEGRALIGTMPALAIMAGLLAYAASRPVLPSPRARLLFAACVVSLALPFSRPIKAEAGYLSLVFPLLCVALLAVSARRRDRYSFVTSLLDGIALYLVLNVVLHFAGVTSPAALVRTSSLEALGGGERIIFPISNNLATPAAMAAIYIAGAAICLGAASAPRQALRLAALVCAPYILIGASSRGAMLVAAILLALSVLSTRVLARVAFPFGVVSVALVFLFSTLQALVGAVLSVVVAIVPQFSRGGLEADTTLNFRSVIWARSLHFWSDYTDLFGQVFGYGIRGQEQSGASALYAADVASISNDPRGVSVHNSFLQQLFDGGLVGLAVFVGVLLWAISRWTGGLRRGMPGSQIALPALLACVMTGITEVTLAPGYGLAPTYIAFGLVLMGPRRPARLEQDVDGYPGDYGRVRRHVDVVGQRHLVDPGHREVERG